MHKTSRRYVGFIRFKDCRMMKLKEISHQAPISSSFVQIGLMYQLCKTITSHCEDLYQFSFWYSGLLNGPLHIYSVFLPASDIPRFVGEGNVDLGITGQDQIRESQMTPNVTEVLQLGFGKCELQVQVPESSDLKTVEDLAGKRIATSFEVVAGEYFREVDARVEARDGKKLQTPTKIEYVGGSVEAACALGVSDGIGTWIPDVHVYTCTN